MPTLSANGKPIGRPKLPTGRTILPTIPTEKRCVDCGELKSASEFYVSRYTTCAGNFSKKIKARCKVCDAARSKARWIPHPRTPHPVTEPKVCLTCKLLKPATDFGVRTNKTKTGISKHLSPRCKECFNAARHTPEWRDYSKTRSRIRREKYGHTPEFKAESARTFQRHKEKIRLRNIKFRREHPEIMRQRYIASIYRRKSFGCDKKKAEIRAAIAEALESYRIGDLYWDVYASEMIETPTIDHIVALSSGGANTVDNFCVTSLSNNSSKNKSPLLIWMLRMRGGLILPAGSRPLAENAV